MKYTLGIISGIISIAGVIFYAWIMRNRKKYDEKFKDNGEIKNAEIPIGENPSLPDGDNTV